MMTGTLSALKSLGMRILKCFRTIMAVAVLVSFLAVGSSIAKSEQHSALTTNEWFHVRVAEDDFETIAAFLKSSIEEEGLVISYEGHIAKMMERTSEAVKGDALKGGALIYKDALIYQFCSATLGFRMFEIDPNFIAACPLSVFIYELKAKPGQVYVGYRKPPQLSEAAAKKVFEENLALLNRIIKRAIE